MFLTAEILTADLTKEESKRAKKIKNNKAKVQKYSKILINQVHNLKIEIWRQDQIPKFWKESINIPIHRKGDKLVQYTYQLCL